jgi:hypothetical protein
MPTKYRKEPSRRRDRTHRLLFYISQQTSAKHPDWRDATIQFLWELYEVRDKNSAVSVVVHKTDGVYVNGTAQSVWQERAYAPRLACCAVFPGLTKL